MKGENWLFFQIFLIVFIDCRSCEAFICLLVMFQQSVMFFFVFYVENTLVKVLVIFFDFFGKFCSSFTLNFFSRVDF